MDVIVRFIAGEDTSTVFFRNFCDLPGIAGFMGCASSFGFRGCGATCSGTLDYRCRLGSFSGSHGGPLDSLTGRDWEALLK